MRLMERNHTVLGAVAAALVIAASAVALALETGGLAGGYDLVVELDDVAGLREGEPVRLAGLPAGTIRELRIAEGHMEAVVRVDDHELPADSRARVKMRTALGQRILQLEAGTAWDEPLGDGDRIPLERTVVPDGMPELTDETARVLDGVDTETLDVVVAAATENLRGQRESVGELARAGADLTDVVVEREAELRSLLADLDRLASAVADRDDELLAAIDGFGPVLDDLAERRERLAALARRTEEAVGRTADVVEAEQAAIDGILEEFGHTTDVLDEHALDLAETIAYAGDALRGFAEVGYHGDQPQPHGDMLTTAAGPLGLDVVAGCGGAIDQALDAVIGPDPRSCAEQGNQADLSSGGDDDSADGTAAGQPASRAPARHGLDAVATRALGGGR